MKEPAFHDLYSKTDIKIELNPKEPQNNCLSFTRSKLEPREPWKKGQIFDKTIRIFNSYIGPSGGKKGYQAITGNNLRIKKDQKLPLILLVDHIEKYACQIDPLSS